MKRLLAIPLILGLAVLLMGHQRWGDSVPGHYHQATFTIDDSNLPGANTCMATESAGMAGAYCNQFTNRGARTIYSHAPVTIRKLSCVYQQDGYIQTATDSLTLCATYLEAGDANAAAVVANATANCVTLVYDAADKFGYVGDTNGPSVLPSTALGVLVARTDSRDDNTDSRWIARCTVEWSGTP